MGIIQRIKNLRNWCPQPPDRLPTKLKSYSAPIAVVLAATLIFGISFTLLSSQYALSQSVPQVPVIKTPSDNSSLLPSPAQTPLPATPTPQENASSLISKEEAISLAMPYINQYATENNRTVINAIRTTFYDLRSEGPTWSVFADYDRTNVTGWQYWIVGYEVYVSAKNGQIIMKQAIGIV